MVEQVTISPEEVRGYGNICEGHTLEDFIVSNSGLAKEKENVHGALTDVYKLVYSVYGLMFDFDRGNKQLYLQMGEADILSFGFDESSKQLYLLDEAGTGLSLGFDEDTNELYITDDAPPIVHNYSIALNQSSYTTTGSLSVSATLLDDGVAVEGATVSFTGGTSTVTATTDSNGVATATVNFSSSGTLTASYSNVSDTATVTVSSYIINDDASVDNSSTLFASSLSLRNNGTASVSYNSSHYYVITNTKNAAEAFIEFKPLYGITSSFKVTIRSKGTTNDRCPICLYYYKDNNNWGGLKTETDYTYYSDKTNGTYSEHQTTGTTGLNKNDECIVDFIYDSSLNKMTMNVYDTSMVLKKSINMNVPITLPSSVKWGTTTTWASNTKRSVYEIKAEYL